MVDDNTICLTKYIRMTQRNKKRREREREIILQHGKLICWSLRSEKKKTKKDTYNMMTNDLNTKANSGLQNKLMENSLHNKSIKLQIRLHFLPRGKMYARASLSGVYVFTAIHQMT